MAQLQRIRLQAVLEDLIQSEDVYFQPPTNIRMAYPCIVYARDGSHVDRADNELYLHTKRYQVTVIDRDPDSDLPDLVIGLPMCEFDRFFASDDLNHWVFTLFF